MFTCEKHGVILYGSECLNCKKDDTVSKSASVQGLYAPHYLGGRARNGAHRDKGVVVHAVIPLERKGGGCNFNRSLCRVVPGMRSTGWEEIEQDINCVKYLKALKEVGI